MVSSRVSVEFLNTYECSGDASGLPIMNDEGGVNSGAEEDNTGEFGFGGGDGGDGERFGGGEDEGDEFL